MSKTSIEAEQFRKGTIAPDRWQDYPHHYGKSREIRRYLLEARRSYLNGNLPHAFYNLGVAFHYIQDSYTSLTSRSEKHTSWEEQIEESWLVSDLVSLVEKNLHDRGRVREKYLHILRILPQEVEGANDTLVLATLVGRQEDVFGHPRVDLNFAFRVCTLVSKSVLSSRTNYRLQERLNTILTEHETQLKNAEISFANQITQLIRNRADLNNKKKPSGFLSLINNQYVKLRRLICDFRIEHKTRAYKDKRHLKKVAQSYEEAVKRTVAPHLAWYQIAVPQIDIGIVEKELLSPQEACSDFRIAESFIKYLIDTERISLYQTKESKHIRKSELRNALEKQT